MYVYIKSEPQLWTVGFYSPDGSWHAASDHESSEAAAKRVHYLNGGRADEEMIKNAVRQERSRCARIAEEYAGYIKRNSLDPAYGLNSQAETAEEIARQIMDGD